MSERWAASIPLERSADVLRLWKASGVEVCAVGDRLWLRGERFSESLDRDLRSLLGSNRFDVDDDGLITPHAATLPVEHVPPGPWRPLGEWFRLVPPPRHFSARTDGRFTLRMEPSEVPRPTNLLVTPLAMWCDYAASAPRVRLERWSFAASDDGRAIIHGSPLPPLAGSHYVETEGIAAPAGWTWAPRLDVGVLRQAFELTDGDIVLLATDGSYELIESHNFVGATRSAVRSTAPITTGAAPC